MNNNWKKGLKDIGPDLDPGLHRWLPDGREAIPERDEIRAAFDEYMMAHFNAGPDQYRSIPIKSVLEGLGKTCTRFKDRIPKEKIRIELADHYNQCGVHVRADGSIQFNRY